MRFYFVQIVSQITTVWSQLKYIERITIIISVEDEARVRSNLNNWHIMIKKQLFAICIVTGYLQVWNTHYECSLKQLVLSSNFQSEITTKRSGSKMNSFNVYSGLPASRWMDRSKGAE